MKSKHIFNQFKRKSERGWDTLYWAVDIHDTCIVANYKAGDIPKQFFPDAKEALLKITSRPDCKLILFTCSHPHEIDKYLEFFKSHGIIFAHVNKNPEAENTTFGFFEQKFYTNFILDDKAGFDPETDWSIIMETLDDINYFETTKPLKQKIHRFIYRFLYAAVVILLAALFLYAIQPFHFSYLLGMSLGFFLVGSIAILTRKPFVHHFNKSKTER